MLLQTMNLIRQSLLLILPVALLAGGCKKDEQTVAPTEDNEVITTATLTLTSKTTPTESVSATIENLNNNVDLSRATLNLKANTTYTGVVLLLNKTVTPALDATAEIKEKANEHLFVYTYTAATGPATAVVVTITDKDTNPAPGPYPLGLTTDIKTGASGTGKLNLILRHQPNVKNGQPTPGTTDLDVNFNVVVN
ncbi:MAG TPA: hypothetical protein VK404_04720 [Spirosoma sp.]|nr:hypothetical protein [Spirosoma sp.]